MTMETDSAMLVQSTRFLLHSSRAHIRTGTARKYGCSEMTATVLLSSDSHTGTLKSAVKWASRRRDDWVDFTVDKQRTRRLRSNEHDDLDERATIMQWRLSMCQCVANLTMYVRLCQSTISMPCIGHRDDFAVLAYTSETLCTLVSSRESCGAGDFWLGLKDQLFPSTGKQTGSQNLIQTDYATL